VVAHRNTSATKAFTLKGIECTTKPIRFSNLGFSVSAQICKGADAYVTRVIGNTLYIVERHKAKQSPIDGIPVIDVFYKESYEDATRAIEQQFLAYLENKDREACRVIQADVNVSPRGGIERFELVRDTKGGCGEFGIINGYFEYHPESSQERLLYVRPAYAAMIDPESLSLLPQQAKS
jgi:hypothetical protein